MYAHQVILVFRLFLFLFPGCRVSEQSTGAFFFAVAIVNVERHESNTSQARLCFLCVRVCVRCSGFPCKGESKGKT